MQNFKIFMIKRATKKNIRVCFKELLFIEKIEKFMLKFAISTFWDLFGPFHCKTVRIWPFRSLPSP